MDTTLRSFDSLAELVDALAAADGLDSYDEPLSLLDHSLQTADLVARVRPDDVELQVAALLHDIGFLQPRFTAENHATLGARSVRNMFPARVTRLIASHALAKLYLSRVDRTYAAMLSARSSQTLRLQSRSRQAGLRFERDPDPDACILRRADDFAKLANAAPLSLSVWVPKLESVASVDLRVDADA